MLAECFDFIGVIIQGVRTQENAIDILFPLEHFQLIPSFNHWHGRLWHICTTIRIAKQTDLS